MILKKLGKKKSTLTTEAGRDSNFKLYQGLITFVFSHQTIDWSLSSGRWAFADPESPILPKSRPKRPVEFAEAALPSFDSFLSTGFDAFFSSSCLGWVIVGAKTTRKMFQIFSAQKLQSGKIYLIIGVQDFLFGAIHSSTQSF